MRKLIFSFISLVGSLCFLYLFFTNKELNTTGILFITGFSFLLIVSTIFFVLFLNRNCSKKIKWLENRLDVWNKISYHVNQAGDEVFNELPVGIAIYDDDLEIKWANNYAKSIFQNRLVDSSIEIIKPGMSDLVKSKEQKMTITVGDHYFDVIHNADNKIMYFFDETAREKIAKRYNERVTAIGIIVIDNLDESLKRFDMLEKSTIRGQFLGEISDWVRENGCYLQTINDDRLLMVFDRESLDRMIENKFDILNKTRDISNRNHLKTTISIGIACYDVEHDELGGYAQSAIELAEKRGGDQVVVNIQNEKIQYFGGKTNALEKNSLVVARMQTMALKEAIENSSNVLIMTHYLADCDALGSTLAILRLALSSNKDARIILEKDKADSTVQKIIEKIMADIPEIYSHIISHEQALAEIKPTTLLVITDTQSPKIAMFPDLIDNIGALAVIDHHRTGDKGFINPTVSYVETYVSSTVELVSEMFMFYSSNVDVTPLEASIMLAGIVVDTNNFTFRTGSRTFEAASTLKTLGADMIIVRSLLRDSIEVEQEMASALLGAEIYLNRFAIVTIPDEKCVQDRTMLAKISDKLLTIDGIDTSFTIGKIKNENLVGVSARSIEGVNVQVIMEEMGGGGHFNGAAAQLSGKSVMQVHDEVVEILKRDYENEGEEKMKVILIEDVKGKGKKDDIIDCANGYGNYLISNKLGLVANEENLNALKEAREKARIEEENHLKLMEKLKSEIDTKAINIYIKLGADGKPFGHITTKQVCEEFEGQTGIHLDKRKVELPVEINSVGIYTAVVNLDKSITANFEVNVLEK